MAKSKHKRKLINTTLIVHLTNMGMDVPCNIEDITDYVYDDVCESADEHDWSDGDVIIGLRRWIESAKVSE